MMLEKDQMIKRRVIHGQLPGQPPNHPAHPHNHLEEVEFLD